MIKRCFTFLLLLQSFILCDSFHNLFTRNFGVLTVSFLPSRSGFTGRFSSLLVERAHRQIKDTLSLCSVLLSQYLRDNLSRTRFVFGTILRGTSTESVPLCILCHIVDRIMVDGVSRDSRAPSVRQDIYASINQSLEILGSADSRRIIAR